MGFVGRIKLTFVVPELRSHVVAFLGAQYVIECEPVCAATALVCDLGPAYVKCPG